MSEVPITRVQRAEDRSLPVFSEIEKLIDDIRRRAFAFSEERGFGVGHSLDDWLRAEKELCWPAAELVEADKEYVCELALPGYEPSQIEVTATPREIIVHARAKAAAKGSAEAKTSRTVTLWSAFGSDEVYRRIEFGGDVDVARIVAALKDGVLKVTAPKLETPSRKVPVATAA